MISPAIATYQIAAMIRHLHITSIMTWRLRVKTMRCTATVLMCFIALSASARLVPVKDPADGVLDADLVVIVEASPLRTPGTFLIDEVLLGDAKQHDSIYLGDFALSLVQRSGPPTVEPITPTTRILLFLQRHDGPPVTWEPTYFKSSYFWVQRAEEVALLRRAGERAVNLRKQWEAANDLSDPKQRVAALWPFLSLSSYGVVFPQRTRTELKKLAPISGQYFAEHLDAMSHPDRMLLLPDAGTYGSEELHAKVIALVRHQMRRYEAFLEVSKAPPKSVDWSTMPEEVKDAAGELYYATAGLASFRDRNDLPLLRDISMWSAKYHLEQLASAAVDAFGDIPDQANLPAIEIALREFLPRRVPGMWSIDIDAERALCHHRYPETIPLLIRLLGDDFAGTEAESCLTQIVGRDLGKDPSAWTDWYASHH